MRSILHFSEFDFLNCNVKKGEIFIVTHYREQQRLEILQFQLHGAKIEDIRSQGLYRDFWEVPKIFVQETSAPEVKEINPDLLKDFNGFKK